MEPIIVCENLENFGAEEINVCLGDLYAFDEVFVDPRSLGWRSARSRKFLVGKLKGLNLHTNELRFHPWNS